MTGMDAEERGPFVISVAAELVGLHPQTLRHYEREGLVVPARPRAASGCTGGPTSPGCGGSPS